MIQSWNRRPTRIRSRGARQRSRINAARRAHVVRRIGENPRRPAYCTAALNSNSIDSEASIGIISLLVERVERETDHGGRPHRVKTAVQPHVWDSSAQLLRLRSRRRARRSRVSSIDSANASDHVDRQTTIQLTDAVGRRYDHQIANRPSGQRDRSLSPGSKRKCIRS